MQTGPTGNRETSARTCDDCLADRLVHDALHAAKLPDNARTSKNECEEKATMLSDDMASLQSRYRRANLNTRVRPISDWSPSTVRAHPLLDATAVNFGCGTVRGKLSKRRTHVRVRGDEHIERSEFNDPMNIMSKANPKHDPIIHASTDAILESISDGVFTVDLQWRITSFNRAAEEITGVPRNEAIGKYCAEVFRSSMCGEGCALQQTLSTGKPVIGTSGYIVNPDGERIPISISTAVLRDGSGQVIGGAETFRDLSDVESLRRELEGNIGVGELNSRSPLMRRIFEVLPSIAASPSTVLILGETGTGKEVLARTIHSLSSRKEKPFIAVNCAALPDTLLESELFGYKTGAFTGAMKDKPGRFALADGGSIFLDEIGEVSPALQVRLLRFLQERTYEALGATRTETSDVRVIVATNKDLAEQMRLGVFREDLYYRVNVVRIELPPLRRRKEDIPLLSKQFIAQFNHLQGKSVQGITTDALSLLMAHEWPGNIRELQNVIERAFVLCNDGLIDFAHLPAELTTRGRTSLRCTGMRSAHDTLDTQAIRSALERNDFNRSAAARDLGIHKTTLFRKIKKLGISLPERDGRAQRRKRQ